MSDIGTDLDATITNAVMARVEAEVARSLSGDEVIGRLVAQALSQEVEVGSTYRKVKKTVLKAALDKAIQDATREAITRLVAEEMPAIEEEIRKAIKRGAGTLAEQFVAALSDAASSKFRFSVSLNLPGD